MTKVGARRAPMSRGFCAFASGADDAVHDNLRNLGLESSTSSTCASEDLPARKMIHRRALTALAELKRQGLIRHLGLSNISPEQLARRRRSPKSSACRTTTTSPNATTTASSTIWRTGHRLRAVLPAGRLHAAAVVSARRCRGIPEVTPMQVALAWLLQRSPNILLIPGTSSVAHLRENLQAAALELPAEVVARLDSIGGKAVPA